MGENFPPYFTYPLGSVWVYPAKPMFNFPEYRRRERNPSIELDIVRCLFIGTALYMRQYD